jgi:hypothetical protein
MNVFSADFIQKCLDDVKLLKEKKRKLELDLKFYEQELRFAQKRLEDYSDRILGIECALHSSIKQLMDQSS